MTAPQSAPYNEYKEINYFNTNIIEAHLFRNLGLRRTSYFKAADLMS
jgi:hypothetical protein